MADQLDIGGSNHTLGATGKPLTDKQQRGYDLVRETAGGITADELGAQLHADRGKHHPDSRCQWCTEEGMGVLGSKAVGPLVIRRRGSGRFEPRDGSGTPSLPVVPAAPSSQLHELPDDLFGEAA